MEVWSSCHLVGCQLFSFMEQNTRHPPKQNQMAAVVCAQLSSVFFLQSSPLSLSNSPLAAVRVPSKAAVSCSKLGKKSPQHNILMTARFCVCVSLRLDTFRMLGGCCDQPMSLWLAVSIRLDPLGAHRQLSWGDGHLNRGGRGGGGRGGMKLACDRFELWFLHLGSGFSVFGEGTGICFNHLRQGRSRKCHHWVWFCEFIKRSKSGMCSMFHCCLLLDRTWTHPSCVLWQHKLWHFFIIRILLWFISFLNTSHV